MIKKFEVTTYKILLSIASLQQSCTLFYGLYYFFYDLGIIALFYGLSFFYDLSTIVHSLRILFLLNLHLFPLWSIRGILI